MKKMRAAGDEPDGWEARSEEEIRQAKLWGAVDFAAKEIDNIDSAMIFDEGREWTRIWHELELEKFTDPGIAVPIDEQTAAKFLQFADQNSRVDHLLKEMMASQVEQGFVLPEGLRGRLVAVLRANCPTAQERTSKPEPKNWSRDYMINHVAGLVCTLYDLDRKRGKETRTTVAASDIIYHAIGSKLGKPIGFGTIQNIIFDPDPSGKSVSGQNQKNYVDVKWAILDSSFENYDD